MPETTIRKFTVGMACYGDNDGVEENNLTHLRHPYRGTDDTFLEHHLESSDPIKQFAVWMNEAIAHKGVIEANAMSLSTVSSDGKPSSRMVLLKGFNNDGFKFYTNYNSRKANEMATNANVALMFYWNTMHRSVRIEGKATKIETSNSTEYFSTRPRKSQIAAHVSIKQSYPIESRDKLLEVEKDIEKRYKGVDVPKPEYWGGYIVKPESIEFWQGQSNRMHDRLRFRKRESNENVTTNPCLREGENGWVYERLMP
ncbi:pyridoxine/pyridoxamine 5'-phosphate oxidase-like [Styela clava]